MSIHGISRTTDVASLPQHRRGGAEVLALSLTIEE